MSTSRPSSLATLILAAFAMSACQTSQAASPEGTERGDPRKLGHFDKVSVSSALEVQLTQGTKQEIRLAGNPDLLDGLELETRGSTLYLRMRKDTRRTRHGTIRVNITMPSLVALSVAGASEVELKGFVGQEKLSIDVSDASDLSGHIEGTQLDIQLSGASSLKLEGNASACGLDASGASNARLKALRCGDWAVQLSGASDAQIHALRSLGPVRLSGASDLNYAGQPKLSHVSISGAADLRSM